MYIIQPFRLESRVQLGNEELILSPLSIGTNWTRLRIGMRYNLATQAAYPGWGGDTGLVASPPFFFGMCAGNKGYTHPSPTAVMGLALMGFTSNSSGNNLSYSNNGGMRLLSKVGSLVNAATGITGSSLYFLSRAPIKTALILDITKVYDASATPNVSVYTPTSATSFIDQSQSVFHEALRSSGTPSGWQFLSVASTPLTADQVNTLDSVSVWWWRSTPVMQVFNIAVVRIL